MSRGQVLVVTGGHPFAREQFLELAHAVTGADGTEMVHVEQPAAQAMMDPHRLTGFDAILAYDMPGIRFTGGDPPAVFEAPTSEYVERFHAVCNAGIGLVFLHHAIASWPAWDDFADIVGGRFHYQPATLDGVDYPDSGYAFDITHTIEVLAPEHPVCAGVPASFEITDELYCFPVLEDRVVPLLASTADFSSEHFASADRAIRGEPEGPAGWSHPSGSRLVGWAKQARASRVVYLQCGDGPVAYANPDLRRLLANALTWVGEPRAGARS